MRQAVPESEKQAIASEVKSGKTQKEVSKKFKRALSTIQRIVSVSRPKLKKSGFGIYTHLRPQIEALRAEGLGMTAVAKKLNVPPTAVNYYFYGKKKPSRPAVQNPPTNGNTKDDKGQNGAFNKHVALGIAYVETERFIATIGERLELPTTFLRSSLSDLLGRSPII